MRKNAGFSLIELQLTIALLLVFMGVFAGISNGYSKILRNTHGKQFSMQAATTGLEGIARELRGAQQIQSPAAAGGTSPVLRFTVVNPANALRLAPNPAPPRTPVLILNQASNMLTIEYSCNGRALVRKVTDSASTVISNQETSDGVVGLRNDWMVNGTMTLSASVQEERALRTLVHTVLLPDGL